MVAACADIIAVAANRSTATENIVVRLIKTVVSLCRRTVKNKQC
jgi:hypothetical protein